MTFPRFFLSFATAAFLTGSGCALFTTRPTQSMSDASAALKAAREAQADVLAPELYRQANDWWFKARQEYKFKQFQYAEEYAEKARLYAEQAEYSSVQQGATRQDLGPPEAIENGNPPRVEEFDTPAPMPYNQLPTGTPPAAGTPSPKQ